MQTVLQESMELLCANLAPDGDFLRKLRTKGAVTSEDVQKIRHGITNADKVEILLDILHHKPVTHYVMFMEILKETREDLCKEVSAIEKKHKFDPCKYEFVIKLVGFLGCTRWLQKLQPPNYTHV